MDIGEYVINVLSAVVAIEYMDHGFEKRYCGLWRWTAFIAGCAFYFITVTSLTQLTDFEGIRGFSYGLVVVGYAFAALEGRWQDFLAAGLLWVLDVLIGTHIILGFMGIITGKNLADVLQLQGDTTFYASLAALVVKYTMGRILSALFKKRGGFHKRENWIMAAAFLLMTLLAMGMFALEVGEWSRAGRYRLTIGILVDETGIIVLLAGLYHRLGKYQKSEMEVQYRQEREEERQENLQDLYRVCREINHWRHDMLRELDILNRMLKVRKFEEVEAHIEKMCGSLRDYPELPQPTGNEGLDAALIKTISKCREKGIRFRYFILGRIQKIDSIDLGNLVDNLLSNGMEACLRVDGERELQLTVKDLGSGLEIGQKNSIAESVLAHNPKLESRKGQKERHGFGMESIYRIIEEYEGIYEYWEEGEFFWQRIVMRYK